MTPRATSSNPKAGDPVSTTGGGGGGGDGGDGDDNTATPDNQKAGDPISTTDPSGARTPDSDDSDNRATSENRAAGDPISGVAQPPPEEQTKERDRLAQQVERDLEEQVGRQRIGLISERAARRASAQQAREKADLQRGEDFTVTAAAGGLQAQPTPDFTREFRTEQAEKRLETRAGIEVTPGQDITVRLLHNSAKHVDGEAVKKAVQWCSGEV